MSVNGEPAVFYVSGVCCSTEEAVLRKQLDSLAGTAGYAFNPVTCRLAVTADVPPARVIRALKVAGFGAKAAHELQQQEPFLRRHALAITTAAAGMLLGAGLWLELGGGDLLFARSVLGLAIIIAGWHVVRKAVGALRNHTLDMNVLMSVAVLGAMAIGHWSEGAAVMVLFSLSLMLESYSVARARKAIQSLMSLSPTRGTVIRDTWEMEMEAAEIGVGELLIVRPGERIPLDGIVTTGESSVDQSPITGESVPVKKRNGDAVFAGSINGTGTLRMKATRKHDETVIAQMVHLVEEAQKARAPVQQWVDRFARVYTPSVLVLSLLVMILPPLLTGAPFGEWFYRALVLLVIACPCALVISTPITIVSALANAARKGVLIKGGKHLEALSSITAIAFDKTGTLTEGRASVTDVILMNSLPREHILRIAASLELQSEHHVAAAVVAEGLKHVAPASLSKVESFEALPGRGVRGMIDGTLYFLGNHELCHERGYCGPEVEKTVERLTSEGKTAVVLGTREEALAVLGVTDTPRRDAVDALLELRRGGIVHIAMITGDNETVARRIGDQLSVTEIHAGRMPGDKVRAVEELKQNHGSLAMVGDGINDAPALAAATVGIAMGVRGTDAALESADIVLMSDNIGRLPFLFGLSRKALSIIKQNIALALSLKLLFLALTLTGTATLWMAVLADDGAALLVILNGLRALTWRGGSIVPSTSHFS